jgi:hypothetical protein
MPKDLKLKEVCENGRGSSSSRERGDFINPFSNNVGGIKMGGGSDIKVFQCYSNKVFKCVKEKYCLSEQTGKCECQNHGEHSY